jgi:hypothetical protein
MFPALSQPLQFDLLHLVMDVLPNLNRADVQVQ